MDEELVWMAGIFDGEGSIGIRRRVLGPSISYSVGVRIGVLESEDISMFSRRFGGNITIRNPQRGGRRKTHHWYLVSRDAYVFLSSVLPYLKWKKTQAELVMELQERLSSTKGPNRLSDIEILTRDGIYDKLIAMHNGETQ